MLFIAQGAYVGRAPLAPGTFGSLVGIVWCLVLLSTGAPCLVIGCVAGVASSVALCDLAARWLGDPDPGSVVLDEIISVPLCFGVWLLLFQRDQGHWPGIEFFRLPQAWLLLGRIFVAFRVFDIWKPWPVYQSQRLPGGWGVTIDDVLAAGFVNLVSAVAWWVWYR